MDSIGLGLETWTHVQLCSTWPGSRPAVFRGDSGRSHRRPQRQRAVGDRADPARPGIDRAAWVFRRRLVRRSRLRRGPRLGRQRTGELLRQPSVRVRAPAKIRRSEFHAVKDASSKVKVAKVACRDLSSVTLVPRTVNLKVTTIVTRRNLEVVLPCS